MNSDLSYLETLRASKIIASLMGLNFTSDKWHLLNRGLDSAAIEMGFSNTKDLIQMLMTTQVTPSQIETLASHITITETYFWREPQVFDAFAAILEEYMASKNGTHKTINIWCAACSTGEEAYSIAIALRRVIPNYSYWKINIFATDINTKTLETARIGIYGEWSFRNAPPWLKEKYFKKLGNGKYELIPEIKSMVTFSAFNLIQKDYTDITFLRPKMDIIFCRNVLMYFSDKWATKASQNLYNSLSTNGWLVVASCELSSILFSKFAPVNFPGAVLYRKPLNKLPATVEPLMIEQNHLFLDSFPTGLITISEDPFANNNYATSNQDTYFIAEGTPNNETVTCENLLPKQTLEIFQNTLAEQKTTIKKLANQGKLDEALLNCNNAIAYNLLAADMYFLQATILQELNKNNEAVVALKQAIYINPNYLICHFTLGNLLMRQGDSKAANQYFNNTLELLNSSPKDDIIQESEGLSSQQIKEIILATLQKQVI
jgi:chemotaxis protein methyltransferase CheR